MRLTWKDAAATALVAVVVALYLGFLTDAGLPLVSSPRVLAAVGLLLGIGACAAGGSMVPAANGRPAPRGFALFSFVSTVAFLAGVLVIITRSEALLAVQIGTIVALWLAATVRHLLSPTPAGLTSGPAGEQRPPQTAEREREMSRR